MVRRMHLFSIAFTEHPRQLHCHRSTGVDAAEIFCERLCSYVKYSRSSKVPNSLGRLAAFTCITESLLG